MTAFCVPDRTDGKPQYHPRLMLAWLIYCYANGTFSSRRIERATHRDIAVRFVAANLHPDHDTITAFRRTNTAAIEAAFLQAPLLAGRRAPAASPARSRSTAPRLMRMPRRSVRCVTIVPRTYAPSWPATIERSDT
jgi:hypothetical protein